MLSFIVETTFRASLWLLTNSISYGYRSFYPIQIEAKKSCDKDLLDQYWRDKSKYKNNHWVGISRENFEFQSTSKKEVLKSIAEDTESDRYLLIKVGQENWYHVI